MATLPDGVGLDVSLRFTDQPTNTFLIDWSSKQISRMDDGLAAMRQAIEIVMQNERFRWQIYDSNFGTELEDLIGEEYDYIVSELPRRIEEAFSMDSRIMSVENFQFSEQGSGKVTVSFDVVTVYGTLSEEVET